MTPTPQPQSSATVSQVHIQTLDPLLERNQIWPRMADKYGVENPMPPWKSSLDGMCDALDKDSCQAEALTFLDRRNDEDALSASVYAQLPYPENQLMALAHSLVARGVIDEQALAERMRTVRARLEAETD